MKPLKNPGVAVILSFLWPGLGQLYNEDYPLGVVALVFSPVIAIFTVWMAIPSLGLSLLLGLAWWIWIMRDAHSEAVQHNAEATKSAP